MASKIFRSTLGAALAVLLASLVVFTGFLYDYFGNLQSRQLQDELSLAAAGTEQLGEAYLEQLDSDRYRLTWVAADGTVLFDNQADAATMENHGQREEILQALTYGSGGSVRYSDTLTQKIIYEAVRLADGTVLRISVSRATAGLLVLGMLHPIALVLILAVVLSAVLARRLARRVTRPLNELDLEHPMENNTYEELSPLLYRIHTQHQQIQLQLQDLQRRQDEFRQITEHMQEGLVLLDQKGCVVSINHAARQLFRVEGDCTGADFLTLERGHEMRQALARAADEGHSQFCQRCGGREYQFDLSSIRSEGSVHGTVILAFDVTDQVDAERNRREFTANVSHELKTPLQSIIGSAELMENGIVQPQDVPRFIGHIRREATRLVTLIEDIIRLSQLDEGGEMPREEVALLPLAREVCESLEQEAGEKNVALTVTGDEDARVEGVRRLLFEVIYNLCDNAIKYNHPGGHVDVSVRSLEGRVELQVRDDGIGIAPEHQDKVFQRFYRVDKSHSKQSGGTGLGLSIVKHAVQYHHGRLSLDSTPGKGTTITVTLEA